MRTHKVFTHIFVSRIVGFIFLCVPVSSVTALFCGKEIQETKLEKKSSASCLFVCLLCHCRRYFHHHHSDSPGCKMKENSSQEEETGRRRPNCCSRKFTSAYLEEKKRKRKDCKQLSKCDMQFGELANCVLVSWYKESCNRSSAKPWEI